MKTRAAELGKTRASELGSSDRCPSFATRPASTVSGEAHHVYGVSDNLSGKQLSWEAATRLATITICRVLTGAGKHLTDG